MIKTKVFCDHCGKEISKSYRDVRIKIENLENGNYTSRDYYYNKDFELCDNCTLQLNNYIDKYMEGCNNG